MIPKWNNAGVLPPIWPGEQGHSYKRSPYHVSISDVINSFAFSQSRREILKGFLNYRNALYQGGILQGFQWINGSFIENVEILENRAPNDLDVVTFFHLPHGMNQKEMFQKHSYLFMTDRIKQQFKVDGYICLLGEPMDTRHVQYISYWYSMWSHRRNGLWKGFLQVGLSQNEDELAHKALELRGQS